jgi:hypothetical protein
VAGGVTGADLRVDEMEDGYQDSAVPDNEDNESYRSFYEEDIY